MTGSWNGETKALMYISDGLKIRLCEKQEACCCCFSCFLLFSLSSAYLYQCSPVPAAATPPPMPHDSRLHRQLLSHSLSPPAEEKDLLSATPDTTTTPTPCPSLPEPSWRFSRVQAETWHLSYTCIGAPLGRYLALGLRQLYRCYFCTIPKNCLCWCFPEPGVVSDCSAVFLPFLLRLLLHLLPSEAINLGS